MKIHVSWIFEFALNSLIKQTNQMQQNLFLFLRLKNLIHNTPSYYAARTFGKTSGIGETKPQVHEDYN